MADHSKVSIGTEVGEALSGPCDAIPMQPPDAPEALDGLAEPEPAWVWNASQLWSQMVVAGNSIAEADEAVRAYAQRFADSSGVELFYE